MLIMSLSERVESKLQEEFSPSHMVLRDNSNPGCGAMFDLEIVSGKFEGQRLLNRQRMVNKCIAPELANEIHGFTMMCKAPSEV
ncbi:MAG: uncharacterized protein KVP18_005152 [Porospora cf. gigantea A]|uniref:uncharacterized protein n=1 Tax=Porospora cf. gigantea A TaxID=2853593 RepID=UPI00355A7321|nr:MAG: hypothetical protein KVP18_005152 [Porospora cf. gigantea A]